MKNTYKLSVLIALSTISACTSLKEEVPRFENMSCYELAKEIGKWDSKLSRAEADGDFADWEFILADNDDEETGAAIDSLGASMSQSQARDYLAELRRIEKQKQCR